MARCACRQSNRDVALQQFDDPVVTNEMHRADDDQVVPILSEHLFDSRQPLAIAVDRQLAEQLGRIVRRIAQQAFEFGGVTVLPGRNHLIHLRDAAIHVIQRRAQVIALL
jgi:hypothetical protein